MNSKQRMGIVEETGVRQEYEASICLIIALTHIKDFPLHTWIPEIDIYVSELLRLEGRGDFTQDQAACKICLQNDTQYFYRCIDCHV
jgi:hypothetical protein